MAFIQMAERRISGCSGGDWRDYLLLRRILLLWLAGVCGQGSRSKHLRVDYGRCRLEPSSVQRAAVQDMAGRRDRAGCVDTEPLVGMVSPAGRTVVEECGLAEILSAAVVYVVLLARSTERDCVGNFHNVF